MYSMCVLVGLTVSVQAQGYGFNSHRGLNRGMEFTKVTENMKVMETTVVTEDTEVMEVMEVIVATEAMEITEAMESMKVTVGMEIPATD